MIGFFVLLVVLVGSTILATGGRSDQVLPILLHTVIVVYLLRKKAKSAFEDF